MLRPAIVVAVVALTGCTFPSADPGPAPTAPATTGAAPSGVQDPAADPELKRFYQQTVDWVGCPDGDGMECAKVTVPVDWSKPAGDTLRMAVNRRPADGTRIGSLVVNPGGPGASGLEYAAVADQAFGGALLSSFDIVGFDPRGVGESDPVQCLPDSQLDAYYSGDSTPDDAAELAKAVADSRRFARACTKNTGALLGHVDTGSAVRDLDVLRAALGEEVLTFRGASYGTYLGGWYAELFPWRVGRMVLDGAVDPSLTSAEFTEGQVKGFSRVLKAYVRDCQGHGGCPLRGSLQQGLDQLGEMVRRADAAPLRTTDPKRPLTQNLMLVGVIQALYSERLWPVLTIALQRAQTGDGGPLLKLADSYLRRDSRGRYGQIFAALPAISCLDTPENRSVRQIAAAVPKLAKRYPPLGAEMAWGGLGCVDWPLPGVMKRKKLSAEGAAPILVVGTVDDPATPYEWAKALASQLSSGRLLTWEGASHTAYRQGSKCIDGAVEAYLLNGGLPAEGTRCR